MNAVSSTFFAAILTLLRVDGVERRPAQPCGMTAFEGEADDIPEIDSVDASGLLSRRARRGARPCDGRYGANQAPRSISIQASSTSPTRPRLRSSTTSIATESSAPAAVTTTTPEAQQDPGHERAYRHEHHDVADEVHATGAAVVHGASGLDRTA